MRKTLSAAALLILLSTQAFAAYVIVLKDGTRYNAKSKWTMQNGKAVITLETGAVVTLNPNEIDVAKTDQINKLGMGNVGVIGQEQPTQANTPKQSPSLGSLVQARRGQQPAPPTGAKPATRTPPSAAPAEPAPVADQLDSRLKETFERAYENVGIFERKLSGTNRVVRVELTTDSEERVFNAISATSFLIIRNAGMDNSQIETVELFMKTTTGGAAGRFQMTRPDAEMIYQKNISIPDYFLQKVIY